MQRQRAVFYAYDDHAPILAPLQGAPHIKQHTQGKPWASMFSSPFGAQIPSEPKRFLYAPIPFSLVCPCSRLWTPLVVGRAVWRHDLAADDAPVAGLQN
jgi:hypothetical protein